MKNENRSKVLGVIPARYQSSRFPGKPLVKIHGKSLIQHTYESSIKCPSIDHIVVATDDKRIFDHVRSFGGEVAMTSESCPTGTDRIVDLITSSPTYDSFDIILNLQGDHPTIDPDTLDAVTHSLTSNPDAVLSTAVTPIASIDELNNPNVVKCVFNQKGKALYFSRSPLPGQKSGCTLQLSNSYQHLGIYCFKKDFLLQYGNLSSTPLQLQEDLEQLKVLEHGYPIYVAVVKNEAPGVDTPDDIQKIERVLCKQNLSLSQAESSHP